MKARRGLEPAEAALLPAAQARYERVVAREFTPRARAVLVVLGSAVLLAGVAVLLGAQAALLDVPLAGTADRPARLALGPAYAPLPPEALSALGGGLAGVGLAVLLHAFADPLVRHRRGLYVALVPAAAALGRLAALEARPEARPGDVLVVHLAPFALGLGPAGLVLVAAALAVLVLAAWCLLRPFDLEGTLLFRRYLAADAVRAAREEEIP